MCIKTHSNSKYNKKNYKEMVKPRKVIKIKKGTVGKICADLNVSQPTVWLALAFGSYSDTAELIRKKALEEYGGYLTTTI
jgi:hypothetical protein